MAEKRSSIPFIVRIKCLDVSLFPQTKNINWLPLLHIFENVLPHVPYSWFACAVLWTVHVCHWGQMPKDSDIFKKQSRSPPCGLTAPRPQSSATRWVARHQSQLNGCVGRKGPLAATVTLNATLLPHSPSFRNMARETLQECGRMHSREVTTSHSSILTPLSWSWHTERLSRTKLRVVLDFLFSSSFLSHPRRAALVNYSEQRVGDISRPLSSAELLLTDPDSIFCEPRGDWVTVWVLQVSVIVQFFLCEKVPVGKNKKNNPKTTGSFCTFLDFYKSLYYFFFFLILCFVMLLWKPIISRWWCRR